MHIYAFLSESFLTFYAFRLPRELPDNNDSLLLDNSSTAMQYNQEKKTQAQKLFNKLLKIFKMAILIP